MVLRISSYYFLFCSSFPGSLFWWTFSTDTTVHSLVNTLLDSHFPRHNLTNTFLPCLPFPALFLSCDNLIVIICNGYVSSGSPIQLRFSWLDSLLALPFPPCSPRLPSPVL